MGWVKGVIGFGAVVALAVAYPEVANKVINVIVDVVVTVYKGVTGAS